MPATNRSMAKPPRSPIPAELRAEMIQRAKGGESYGEILRWINPILKKLGIKTEAGAQYQLQKGTLSKIARAAGVPEREPTGGFREKTTTVKLGYRIKPTPEPETEPDPQGEVEDFGDEGA